MYLHQGNAGVMCFMESVKTFGPEVEGQHQSLAWGNPILQMYCFDQLQRWFRETGFPNTLDELERRGFMKSYGGNLRDIFNAKFNKGEQKDGGIKSGQGSEA